MPEYVPVEYDPWESVPVDYDPWEGQPDPWAYRPVAEELTSPDDLAELNKRYSSYYGDKLLLAPGQVKSSIGQPLGEQAAGIYLGYKPPPPGDEVVYDPMTQSYGFRPNIQRGTVWPGAGSRYLDTINREYSSGAIYDAEALRGFAGKYPRDELVPEVKEQILQGPGYLRRIGDYTYRPPITPEDWDAVMQRPPVALDLSPATPPQAMFEDWPWRQQGEAPESYGRIFGPYPGASGISGEYSGRGKFLKDYFGPNSPLRGTYRHSIPF